MSFFPSALFALVCCCPLLASAQTLTINNDIQTYATLASTTVTMTGKSELRITGTTAPITGSVIHLNSADAWFLMTGIAPSVVNSTYLSQIRVNGAVAVHGSNCRVVMHGDGAVVIPHAPTFAPMTVYSGKLFTGTSMALTPYTAYTTTTLGALADKISSFKLKRGYTATIAQNSAGSGVSKNYVAQDGDLEVSVLPDELNDSVSFVRIFPWRWVNKKGIAGNITAGLNVRWWYNWNLDQNSPLDIEYVAIRHTRWWPGLGQDWSVRGVNHLLGYNEPDHVDQANLAVGDAIYSWPDLLATGLRVGSPAPTDGGVSWLTSFMSQASAADLRVDFVAVHYYRSYSSASDPVGATTQFYNFLKNVHDLTGKPVWVTEWNNGANWTSGPDPTLAQNAATVAKMIEMLDDTPWVERYSLYNWVEDVRRVKWDDGSLTAAGVTYRDKVSPLSYWQEIPEVPTPAGALYRFEANAADSSGNGHAAVMKGAAKFATTAGRAGQQALMSGSAASGDYAQLSPRLGDSTDFTFSAWVYWAGGANWQRIFDLGADTTHYMFLTPSNSSGVVRFAIKDGGAEQQLSYTAALPVNTWTHVAVTISGNTGKLFINGAVVATNTGMTINPVDIGTQFNFLGKSQITADPYFAGRLDDVQFLPYALTDAKVTAAMTNNPPVFTSTTITGAAGVQGTAYNGTIAGTATDPDAGNTISYSKISGPAWLAVATGGALSGTPTFDDEGAQEFVVVATDSTGATASALLTITLPSVAGNGTWIANASGVWSDATKWSASFPGNGAGNTADFNTLNITGDVTVTLDRTRSIGGMVFGDTSGAQNWTLNATGGSTLTLDNATSPIIRVNQNTVTLALALAGTNGLTKDGAATLLLSGDNSLSGTLHVDTSDAASNDGILRIANPDAITDITAIAIANSGTGRSSLELDGTTRDIVSAAPLNLAGRNTATVALRSLAGNNTLSGLFTLGTGGSTYLLQSDAGLLTFDGNISSTSGGTRTLTFSGSGGFFIGGEILDGTTTVTALAVTKTGTGALTLQDKDNTFSGNIVVSGGTLTGVSSASFNFGNAPVKGPFGNPQTAARTITVNSGGTLVFGTGNILGPGGSTTAPAVGVIVNQGGIVRLAAPAATTPGAGGGDCNVFGAVTLTGGTFTTGNGFSAAYQSAILMGNVTTTGGVLSTIDTNATNPLANGLMLGKTGGGTVTFDVASGGLAISAPLVNAANGGIGALTKTGAGTMTLAGANTFTGATTISAGKLVLSGTLTSAVNASTGTLAASGTPATTGGVTIPATGRFETNLTGPGTGQLTVGGAVTLGGALDIVASAGLPNGASFTILNKTSAGAVSGIFAGKIAGTLFSASGYQWLINYAGGDGNDVVLSIATAQQIWRQTYFGSIANSGSAADTFDANADGETNFMEFSTGQNPSAATSLPPIVVRNGALLEFTYTRANAALADGVIFNPEWCDTLTAGGWSNVGVTEQILSDNGTVQTVKASVDAGSGPRFLHLKISRP